MMKHKSYKHPLFDKKIKSIRYLNSAKIIETEDENYVIKTRKRELESLFQYLNIKNFSNYLPLENSPTEPLEIYRYIEEDKINDSDKAIELVYIMSMLHIKTTTYENINLDNIKKIYEDILNKLNYLQMYYFELQDNIENREYMSPAEYLLIRNISKIYAAINFSKQTIEKWYQEKKTQKKERQVMLHNNLKLEHFLKKNNSYIINWNKARKGIVVYDFLNFYKNEYLTLEMESLFDIYKSKYQYTHTEQLLFYSLLAIPPKVELKTTNYLNTIEVRNLLTYLDKTNQLILKEYKENQKTNKEEFKQQNNSV